MTDLGRVFEQREKRLELALETAKDKESLRRTALDQVQLQVIAARQAIARSGDFQSSAPAMRPEDLIQAHLHIRTTTGVLKNVLAMQKLLAGELARATHERGRQAAAWAQLKAKQKKLSAEQHTLLRKRDLRRDETVFDEHSAFAWAKQKRSAWPAR